MPINLNGGARTVYAGGLTDYRNQILKEATGDNGVDANAFNANNLAHSINAG